MKKLYYLYFIEFKNFIELNKLKNPKKFEILTRIYPLKIFYCISVLTKDYIEIVTNMISRANLTKKTENFLYAKSYIAFNLFPIDKIFWDLLIEILSSHNF